MPTKAYSVRRYNDGKKIGSVGLTEEQFARYESLAQQPEGLVPVLQEVQQCRDHGQGREEQ